MLLTSDLRGQVVAIVGACSPAGASMARSLADQGAALMLGDDRLSALHALAARITAEGGHAQYRAVDLTRRASIDMLVTHALDAYGRIDLLLDLGGQVAGRAAQIQVHPTLVSTPPARAGRAGRAFRAAHP